MRIDRALALTAVVAALALAACASRLRGETSYDEGADFSRYHSYALVPLETGSPAARAIAEREVRRALEAKGLSAETARPPISSCASCSTGATRRG